MLETNCEIGHGAVMSAMVFDAGVPPLSATLLGRDRRAFAQELGESFARFGFAVVCDHGLDARIVAEAYARAKEFFSLTEAEKRAYHVQGGAGQRGYVPFGVEAAKGAALVDLKEFWHVGRELPPGHRYRAAMPDNLWPREIPNFRRDIYPLFQALDAIGVKLLGSIALFLDLEETYFNEAVREGNSVLRLLHYPPVSPSAKGVRASAHEDINAITLLLGAEEAGLQLLDREGRWIDINPPPGALVVNIGDMLQRLTNHRLPSTTHRVTNPPPGRAHLSRYSIPFFVHFAPDYLIETLPSCITREKPNLYPEPVTAQDYLYERLREIRLA